MARPTITYNASTGSDTAASGAGPATAVTGTGAAYSGDGAGGGTQTIITLTNTPDLSGVATDGSTALWLNTASGERHLFRITAVDDGADTVTVFPAPDTAINSGSAVDYAIGGKRQTLEADSTNPDWDDVYSGWTFELEAGTYTVTSSITAPSSTGNHTDGPFTITSSNPGTVQPVIDRTGSFNTVTPDASSEYALIGLKFTRSSGSSAHGAIHGNGAIIVKQCEFDGNGMDTVIDGGTAGILFVSDSEIYGANASAGSSHGIDADGTTAFKFTMFRTSIHDCDGHGVYANVGARDAHILISNLIYDNTDSGLLVANVGSSNSMLVYSNNLFYGNSGDGFEISDSTGDDAAWISFDHNTMVSNGGYGANVAADQINIFASNSNNHYHGNTSGGRNNLPAGTNDTSGDPLFTSVTDGSENFTPASGSPLLDAGIAAPTS
jgi:hypothetical protein